MEEILGKQPPQLFGIPLKKKSGLLIVWKILEPVYLFSLLMFSVACQQFFIQSLTVANVRSRTGLLLFGTFELAISMPVEVGKSYIQCLAKKLLFSPLYEVK